MLATHAVCGTVNSFGRRRNICNAPDGCAWRGCTRVDASRQDVSSDGELRLQHRTLGRHIRNPHSLARCENLTKHVFFGITHWGNWRFTPMSKRTHEEDSDARKRVAQESHLAALPVELIELIALEAGPSGFKNLAETCQRMRRVLTDNPDIQTEPARTDRAKQRFVREKTDTNGANTVTFQCLPNGVEHGLFEKRNSTGALILRTYYQNGVEHGVEEKWFPNGQLMERITREHGFPVGIQEVWYPNGALRYRIHYSGPRRKSLQQSWYVDGTHQTVARYDVNGMLHGPKEDFNGQGIRIHLDNYVHGKLHGARQDWYDNGMPKYAVTFANDIMHGTSETWYPNGMRKKRCYYVNGKSEGVYKEWDATGQLICREYHINDERNGARWELLPNGTERISYWTNSNPQGATQELAPDSSTYIVTDHNFNGRLIGDRMLSADRSTYNFDFAGAFA